MVTFSLPSHVSRDVHIPITRFSKDPSLQQKCLSLMLLLIIVCQNSMLDIELEAELKLQFISCSGLLELYVTI